MSISILGLDGNPWTQRDMDSSGNNVVTTYHLLGFTGSYVTGGDTLDLSGVAAQIPSGALPLDITVAGNGIASAAIGGGQYIAICKAATPTLKNYLFKTFAAGGTENSATTYSSLGFTTDTILLVITWRKLLSA